MSYDFDTTLQLCGHRQVLERMTVENDFMTLHAINNQDRMRSPINGNNTVILRFNGFAIPQNDPQYGWTIQKDIIDTNGVAKQKIVFNKPVRISSILIELEYVTLKNYCRRCNGKGVLNDLTPAASGSFKRIVDTQKLVQRCLKFVLTSKCTFYPSYTCKIKDFIGKKFGIKSLGVDDISHEVTASLANLKKVQANQQNVQIVTPRELLRDISSIRVTQASDPRYVNLDIDVVNYTNNIVETSLALKVN